MRPASPNLPRPYLLQSYTRAGRQPSIVESPCSFDAKNAKLINLKSAAYNRAENTVTLTPKKPFTLTEPVQLRINSQPASGLQHTLGRLIDGDHNGTPGGNAVALLRHNGLTISAVASGHLSKLRVIDPYVVDFLLAREDTIASNPFARAAYSRSLVPAR
jgi:hypothetical protein